MKNNQKFFITVISMILGSSVLLGSLISCIQGLDVLDGPGYTEGGGDPTDLVSLPLTPQEEMQRKFDKFNFFENKEDGTNVVRIYSHKDVDRFMQMRENGERQSLSYDEVLFLMKDSVRLYMEYDEIVLTDAGEMEMFIFPEGEKDVKISTYHGDFSANSTEKSHELLDKVIYDIYDIFAYRCFVYDTWLESRIEGVYSASGIYFDAHLYVKNEDEMYEEDNKTGFLNMATPVLIKFYNEFEFSSHEEYVNALDSFGLVVEWNEKHISGCVQPCIVFIPGGVKIYYQNMATEIFKIEDFLTVPNELINEIPPYYSHTRYCVFRDKSNRFLYARSLVHKQDRFWP